jgi:hypothetical protein
LKQFLRFKSIGKAIKFPPGQNRPEATAHGAWRPATRGRPKSRLGHGLAAQLSGATGPRGLLQRARAGAVTTHRLHAGRRGGVLTGGLAVARRWQGVAGDLEGVTGKVPGKEERAGKAAFTGGEGAPVVVVGCDEVLQLGRVKGARKLQEITSIGGSGRSSPGNGGRWRRSVRIRAKERPPVARGGGTGAKNGGEGALKRGAERSR